VHSKSVLKRLAAQGVTSHYEILLVVNYPEGTVAYSKGQVREGMVKGEEEAYLAFTLNAFKEIVEKYGPAKIIGMLDEGTFDMLDEQWRKL